MNDAWHWWTQALESPKEIGQAHLPVSVDSPEQGFYRTRYKGKPWEPVAIWKDDSGNWVALRSGKPVKADDVWNWACRNPITIEAYEKALAGEGWADDDPSVAAALAGHNVGALSERELLQDEIESAKQGAEAYATIENDEQAGKAQSLRARMNELAGKADKQREALKKPHLEAGKLVDAEWMPLVKEAKGVADMLRQFIAAFETMKLRERRRLEAERSREDVAPPPITDDKIKGNYGRAASVGTELVVTGISDQDALYQFLRDHPDLKACLRDLGQRALRAGHQPPGIEFEERAKIS